MGERERNEAVLKGKVSRHWGAAAVGWVGLRVAAVCGFWFDLCADRRETGKRRR
jgi:hypothetical protein